MPAGMTVVDRMDLLDKIIILADNLVTQDYIPLDERIAGLRKSWITKPEQNRGRPLIEEHYVDRYERNVRAIAADLFELLGVKDSKEFIDTIPELREEIEFMLLTRDRCIENMCLITVSDAQDGEEMHRSELRRMNKMMTEADTE